MDRRTFLKTATETTLATVVPLPVIKFAEEDINSWNLNTENLDKQVIIQLKIKMIQICGDPTIKVSKLWWVDGEDKKINTITSLEDFEDLYGKAISVSQSTRKECQLTINSNDELFDKLYDVFCGQENVFITGETDPFLITEMEIIDRYS